ncbi:hypothetical protein A3G98_00915 [Candidatus Nomurabacteria bacterium RIFCSPLOWO2_12_FULL_37_8]|uniref:Uncharacterized protein n=1 Tax=Candidatus Nomurabacteria bacterium RIFCSPLOWO2_12_FULL_37_8 TaxID=1801793 RepID=A0A1F6Y547_9BACT|nr:MAG: hypothetical protein A3G98_00915 [Candidatus Nomurabacteria bacterium RIFCSPLOWO2_12_FULL_37_8]
MIVFKFYLSDIQSLFSIVGSLSIGVALLTYFYKKQQDKVLATIEQVVFFREQIITEWTKVSQSIVNKNPKYMFSHIKIKNIQDNIEDLKKEFSFNFKDQLDIFFNSNSLSQDQILNEQIMFLNMLEEFSLRVNHLGTQKHPALESVCDTFVSLIEMNTVALFYMRNIRSNNKNYSAILNLYESWRDIFQKPNIINNLEKHGFISKEKKKEIFKKQREDVLNRSTKID